MILSPTIEPKSILRDPLHFQLREDERTSRFHDDISASRMLIKIFRDVIYITMYNDPAVVRGAVVGHLLEGEGF